MVNYPGFLYNIIAHPSFVLAVISVSLLFKLYYIAKLVPKGLRARAIHIPWVLLLGSLVCSLPSDIAWIIKLLRELFLPGSSYALVTFWIRIAWTFLAWQYTCLGWFIESLAIQTFRLTKRHYITAGITNIITLHQFSVWLFDTGALRTQSAREAAKQMGFSAPLELQMHRFMIFYLVTIVLYSVYTVVKQIRYNNLPKILTKQLYIFMIFLVTPYLLTEFLLAINMAFRQFKIYMYAQVSVSIALFTFMIFYCMQQVMGLRFLNFTTQVQAPHRFNFIDDFKGILSQLSYATNIKELEQTTKQFFKNAFAIPNTETHIICNRNHIIDAAQYSSRHQKIQRAFEAYIASMSKQTTSSIINTPLLIFDDVSFSSFYEPNNQHAEQLTFLNCIDAGICIPIINNNNIVAAIVVSKDARPHKLYSSAEYDEMIIFTDYLRNIIQLLQTKNLDRLLQQEQALTQELTHKQQEIMQYRESIRSFLKHAKNKEFGIVFYKNRRFVFGNTTAKKMIEINPNQQAGHSLTKALKAVVSHVEQYRTAYYNFAKDNAEKELVIYGVPNIDHNNIIIILSRPDIGDVITKHLDTIKDPTSWDYLLYLETTQSGKLINKAIPGTSETIMQTKVDLLKIALHNSAILLHIADDDIMDAVELFHHISLRKKLETITLTKPVSHAHMAITLFGMHQLIEKSEQSLFRKLDGIGTLFIKNIHFLALETQNQLANCIQYGWYHRYQSNQTIACNVRIICSTNQNLTELVSLNKFSANLYQQLKETTISLPLLSELPETELVHLADGLAQQALASNTFKSLLSLTQTDKEKLCKRPPDSLHELKNRIQTILLKKSDKHEVQHETTFNPAYNVTDPQLINAARLGKHALRDPKIMALLWDKFKNQNKIATFLGVNRSSVNRRCKAYKLGQ